MPHVLFDKTKFPSRFRVYAFPFLYYTIHKFIFTTGGGSGGMKLYLTGEPCTQQRHCYFVEGETASFIMDCGYQRC